VEEATKALYEKINKFGSSLLADASMHSKVIVERIHAEGSETKIFSLSQSSKQTKKKKKKTKGINLRYLGLLMKVCKNVHARRLLLLEMAARIVKRDIQSKERKEMKRLMIPTQKQFVEIYAQSFNDILKQKEEFWDRIVYQLKKRYWLTMSKEEVETILLNPVDIVKVTFFLTLLLMEFDY
jgi:hypothetical protein